MASESGGRSKNGVGLFQLIPSKKSQTARLVLDYICFHKREIIGANTREKLK
jgi:hypothetical protein